MGRTVEGLIIQRLPDWRKRFEEHIDAVRLEPFSWGKNDCGVGLAARTVEVITGVDLGKKWRGKYKTPRGAYSAMKRAGHGTVADIVADLLEEVHISQAKIGDIAAIPTDDEFGFALGVVNGERIFTLRPNGAGHVDLLTATRAFKVG